MADDDLTQMIEAALAASPSSTPDDHDSNPEEEERLVSAAAVRRALPPSMRLPPASPYQQGRQDIGYRNRTGSARDFDDMLGVVLDGIAELGLSDSTGK